MKFCIILLLLLSLLGCSHFRKLAWVMSSNPSPTDVTSITNGERIYKIHCISCHGATGLGDGNGASQLKSKPANLIISANKRSTSSFAGHVALGKAFNDEMPKYRGILSEQEIWDVTNYIYSLKNN